MTPNPEAVRALLVAAVPFAYAYAGKSVTPVAPLPQPSTEGKNAGEQGCGDRRILTSIAKRQESA